MNSDIQKLRGHLARKPSDGEAWLSLAQLLSQQSPGRELFHSIEQAIRSLPDRYECWALAATVQGQLNGLQQATRWLEQSCQQNADLVAPRLALASLLSENKPDTALAICNQLDADLPADLSVIATLIRGDALRCKAWWKTAYETYQSVLDKRADDPLLHNNLGCCLVGEGKFAEAEACFRTALAHDPNLHLAQLNLALLHVHLQRAPQTASALEELLADKTLPSDLEQAARMSLLVLKENMHRQAALDRTVQDWSVSRLQDALNRSESRRHPPDAASINLLQNLAGQCNRLPGEPLVQQPAGDSREWAFAETCSIHKIPVERWPEDYQRLLRNESQAVPAAWRVLSDRNRLDSALLAGHHAEAWLCLWHARLMSGHPESLPGQYKLAWNRIGYHPTTPPAAVSATLNIVLTDLLPKLTAGYPRAVFLYLAISKIHAFVDGNGRLARCMMGWECRSRGLPPVVMTPAFHDQHVAGLRVALDGGNIDALWRAMAASTQDAAKHLAGLAN